MDDRVSHVTRLPLSESSPSPPSPASTPTPCLSCSMTSVLPHQATHSWQDAWNSAQDTIARIRADATSSSSPAPRVTRVGKVDAELLDAELVHLLKEPLTKAMNLVDVCASFHAQRMLVLTQPLQSTFKAKFDPELTLFIHLVLYKLSVWDHGASYGAKLQGLKYAPPRSTARILTGP